MNHADDFSIGGMKLLIVLTDAEHDSGAVWKPPVLHSYHWCCTAWQRALTAHSQEHSRAALNPSASFSKPSG